MTKITKIHTKSDKASSFKHMLLSLVSQHRGTFSPRSNFDRKIMHTPSTTSQAIPPPPPYHTEDKNVTLCKQFSTTTKK